MRHKSLQIEVRFDGASDIEVDATMAFIKEQIHLILPPVHRGILFKEEANGSGKRMINCAAYDNIEIKDLQ